MVMNIITRAKIFMADTHMTQAEFAKHVGVHPVTLSRFFNEKNKLSTYEKLEHFLCTHGYPPLSAVPATRPGGEEESDE